jgi:uncharacterized protein (TIGR02996 family)
VLIFPEPDPFLRAILEKPDDDLPRLIYADWLDEHGDPARAEFIRAQCTLARIPRNAKPRPPDYRVLGERLTALLMANRSEWLRPLAVWLRQLKVMWAGGDVWVRSEREVQSRLRGLRFERGFPRELHLHVDEAVQYIGADDRLEPVNSLRIAASGYEGCNPDWIALLGGWAGGPCVGMLTLEGATDEALAALAGTGALRSLESLGLGRGSVTDAGAITLAGWQDPPRVGSLSLWSNAIGDAGATALATSRLLERVEHLDLSHNRVGRAGVIALGEAFTAGRVRSVNLGANRIDFETRRRLRAWYGSGLYLG